MAEIDLSIVIVSYNTKKATLECIDSVVKSLKNSKLNYEIIVLDNASTDGSLNELMNYELRI
ncbi:MAG: glycosyltransferase [Patescibacteria group bacterium]